MRLHPQRGQRSAVGLHCPAQQQPEIDEAGVWAVLSDSAGPVSHVLLSVHLHEREGCTRFTASRRHGADGPVDPLMLQSTLLLKRSLFVFRKASFSASCDAAMLRSESEMLR